MSDLPCDVEIVEGVDIRSYCEKHGEHRCTRADNCLRAGKMKVWVRHCTWAFSSSAHNQTSLPRTSHRTYSIRYWNEMVPCARTFPALNFWRPVRQRLASFAHASGQTNANHPRQPSARLLKLCYTHETLSMTCRSRRPQSAPGRRAASSSNAHHDQSPL